MIIFKENKIKLKSAPIKKRLLGEGLWVASGQIMAALGLLIGTRFLTEYFPPAVFGKVNLLLGVSAFFYSLLCVPLMQAMFKLYPTMSGEGKVPHLRRNITSLLSRITGSLVIIILLTGGIYSFIYETSIWIFIILAGLLAVDVTRGTETNFFSAARRHKPFALWISAEAWLRPAIAILLLGFFNVEAQTLLFGYLIASSIIILIYFIFIKREGVAEEANKAKIDKQLVQEIKQYALPLMPLAVLGWISGLSDRYFIGGLIGFEQVGIYAAIYGLISRPFLMLSTIMDYTLRPLYFDAIYKEDKVLEKKTFRYWILFVILACFSGVLVVAIFSDTIVYILLAEKYRSGSQLIPWIAIGYSLFVISQVFEKPCYAYKKTNFILAIQITGAIASFCIEIPAIYYFGLIGAAMAIPIYFSIQLVTSIYCAKKVLGDFI
ncbi:MAG: lipopolysaccharide biosynthesis protein [Candidatus Schekmanbacteria bacterium]|nr:lipopolysaccharide biosynthesis protein [Candidatus Schekmanbacteria bacterium]